MADKTKLVRIKPYAPRAGHKVRTYVFGGKKYEEKRGWVLVSDTDLCKKLAELKLNGVNIFDVCKPEDAVEMDRKATEAPVRKSAADLMRDASNTKTELPPALEDKPLMAVNPEPSTVTETVDEETEAEVKPKRVKRRK